MCSASKHNDDKLLNLQIQTDRDKHAYEYEQLQSQVDKMQVQNTRLVKDKDDALLDLDRLREKNEKLSVSFTLPLLFSQHLFGDNYAETFSLISPIEVTKP